ncbi:MAG: Tol-Pal system beta propeller repeat protein TolB [Pseudomonadota bacterium]
MILVNNTMYNKTLFAFIFLVIVGILLGQAYPATARVYIDINSPYLRKIPTAIPDFKETGGEANLQLRQDLTGIMRNTLSYSGLFNVLDPGSFLTSPEDGLAAIRFENWRAVGSELLVTGGVKAVNKSISLELRLFDTFGGRLIVGKRYSGEVSDGRRMILKFCNEIMYHLTGSKGIFDTQIAFISTTTGNKEVYISDFDGYNPRQFTKNKCITLSPSWSYDSQWIAYMSYLRKKPEIFIKSINGDKSGDIISFKGLNSSPVWVPKELLISATLTVDGNSEIYLLTPAGKIVKKLTSNWGIDTSPSWSPDGKKFAFVSDRAGCPQIYIKELETDKEYRLTYSGNYNTSPEWSPRGDYIAYCGVTSGHFQIFAIGADGRGPYQLTHNPGNSESPTWSPDGTLIAFSSTKQGSSRIYVMAANGADQRLLLTLPGEQTFPRWSRAAVLR